MLIFLSVQVFDCALSLTKSYTAADTMITPSFSTDAIPISSSVLLCNRHIEQIVIRATMTINHRSRRELVAGVFLSSFRAKSTTA